LSHRTLLQGKRVTNTLLHVNGGTGAKAFIFAASYCMYGRRVTAELRSQGVQEFWS
jgi:hypothetical protein